jgi:xanthine/uracil permease
MTLATKLFVARGAIYLGAAAGLAFDTNTKDLTLEQLQAHNWFDLMKLAFRINAAWIITVVAFLDGIINKLESHEKNPS